jgi:hypothetical protein
VDKWWQNATSMLAMPELQKAPNGEPLCLKVLLYRKENDPIKGKSEFKHFMTDIIPRKDILFLYNKYKTKDLDMFENADDFLNGLDKEKQL